MATKNSRLSEILKQEYKTSGAVGGLASAAGKRVLEKLDIRNALFGGSGVGSLIGRKIFGKGYSAISDKPSTDKLSSQSAPILAAQSDKLDVIGINTQITAKNSMALPSMARDMNVMRQNIIKMVKLQGGTPTNKADAFFSKAKDRESMYENLFKKDNKAPTKVETKKEEGGLASFVTKLLGPIGIIVAGLVAAVETGISALKTSFDIFKSALGGLAEWILKNVLGRSVPVSAGTPATGAALATGVISGVAVGGALATGAATSVMASESQKANRKALQENSMLGAMGGDTSFASAILDAQENAREEKNKLGAERMKNYKPRNTDTAASKVTADDDAKINAEKYLGAPMSSTDWDLLKRTVYAESSRNEQEYANVMAVILNRARNSGKTIPEVLFEKNQFQAVTGARGEGPSSNFKQGPDARSAQMIMSSTNSLQNISTSLDSFTAANAAAYGAVGGQAKFNKKMAEMQAANGKTVGATVFAENLYRPSGKTINDTSTMMASMSREALMPQSPNINITAPQAQQAQQHAPITIAAADVMDTDFGKLLARMY